ncbi:MAG TPA: hypothetical protein VH165_05235 [Kofleriaceae bacterium]|nr:hypothetical protein [Kofleriaceae bacterium]
MIDPPAPAILSRAAGPGTDPVAHASPGPSARAGMFGRIGYVAPRSLSRSPKDPYADLAVSYDDVSAEADVGSSRTVAGEGLGDRASGTGTGDGLAGTGGAGGGGGLWVATELARLPLPAPPPSLARPPVPRYDYSDVIVRGSRQYSGKRIRILLRIDAHGVVRGASMLESLEVHMDRRAVAIALGFEFEPAVDSAGEPIEGKFPWTFVIHG